MSTHSTVDRESLQQLLANAFAVQESHMDTQSLSAIAEIQRLITAGDLDQDEAMHLIAARTRNVANASGVAIGLLQDDQIVYRAGSGVAATYPGRQVTARLVVPTGTRMSREILRVEDAQRDERMQAAICRQLGANALLILVILHNRVPAGVLQIHFGGAHFFQDRELRVYRVMAGLVGEAMTNVGHLARRRATATDVSTVPPPVEQIASSMKQAGNDDRTPQPAGSPTMETERGKRAPRLYTGWSVAMAALLTVCAMAYWVPYSLRYPAALSRAAFEQRLNLRRGKSASSGVARTELPKLPKPSPILAVRAPNETRPAMVRQPSEAMHVATKVPKNSKPGPHLALTRHATKIRTAAVKHGPATAASRKMEAKSRMIVQGPKPASPATPKRASPRFDSKVRDSKLQPAPQASVPESSSTATRRIEPPAKSESAETDHSGPDGFDDAGKGADRSASVAAPAQDPGAGSSDVTQSESMPSIANQLPPKASSPSYNQEWRRLRPQRSSAPDESWRKRRPIIEPR